MSKQSFVIRENGHFLGVIALISKTESVTTAKRLQLFIARKYGRMVTAGFVL